MKKLALLFSILLLATLARGQDTSHTAYRVIATGSSPGSCTYSASADPVITYNGTLYVCSVGGAYVAAGGSGTGFPVTGTVHVQTGGSIVFDSGGGFTCAAGSTCNAATASAPASVPWTVPNGGSGLTTKTTNVLYKGNGASAEAVSSITDNGTTVTTTDTGGYSGPAYTATGSNAGFTDFTQGSAQTATASSVGFQAPTSVTSAYHITLPGAPAAGFVSRTNATPSSLVIWPSLIS